MDDAIKLFYGLTMAEIFPSGITVVVDQRKPLTDRLGQPTGEYLDFNKAWVSSLNGKRFQVGETVPYKHDDSWELSLNFSDFTTNDELKEFCTRKWSDSAPDMSLHSWLFGFELTGHKDLASFPIGQILEKRSILATALEQHFGCKVEPKIYAFAG
jgi:hypothetical protein